MKIGDFETHPAADIFPMLDAVLSNALAEDIRKNGLIEPILLFDDLVLDGRCRLAACLSVGIEPRFETFEGDPWDLSWSANVERRHLEPGTRAVYRLKWESERGKWDERWQERKTNANKARSETQRGRPKNVRSNVVPNVRHDVHDPEPSHAQRELAHDAGVSSRTARSEALRGRPRGDPQKKVGGNVAPHVPTSEESKIRGRLAREAGVSIQTAQKAITMRSESPEQFDAVAEVYYTRTRSTRP